MTTVCLVVLNIQSRVTMNVIPPIQKSNIASNFTIFRILPPFSQIFFIFCPILNKYWPVMVQLWWLMTTVCLVVLNIQSRVTMNVIPPIQKSNIASNFTIFRILPPFSQIFFIFCPILNKYWPVMVQLKEELAYLGMYELCFFSKFNGSSCL